jgi:putative ABC transport system permease protein
MTMVEIRLDAWDLALASLLVILLAALLRRYRLGLSQPLLVSAARMAIQLLLVGLVLRVIFDTPRVWWIALAVLVMLLVAGREMIVRQKRPLAGWWGFGIGTTAMFVSSFTVTLFGLLAVVQPDPWYLPQYSIPIFGMILGNTMTGITLTRDRLTQTVWQERATLEQRLALGEKWNEAVGDILRDSLRSGLIPVVNAMATAGIVSLPGMMTGQILAGQAPVEAVKYQILIWLLIAAGTGFGIIAALHLAARRLFDERERLRLDRLRSG